jgi:hypothetical protein
MTKTSVANTISMMILIFLIVLGAPGMGLGSQDPNNWKVILNCDEFNFFRYQLRWLDLDLGREPDANETKAMLEHIVDEHANAQVDAIVHTIFSLPWGASTEGFSTFYRAPSRGWLDFVPGMPAFEDAGFDFVQFLIDLSHSNSMAFVACLRMNDRHSGATEMPFYVDNPQWRMTSYTAMDYKYAGVRNAMLDFIEEVLARYDVDGIELDWMRHVFMFEPSEAQQNAPLLTDFIAQTRQRLDAAAVTRGVGRLALGVRVPQTVEECDVLGFDIGAWAQQGVDYICPADFHCIDFNIKVEDYVNRTTGTNCKIFPTLFGTKSIEGASRRGLTHEEFGAAANNYYAFGAYGVSAYNFYTQFLVTPGNEFNESLSDPLVANAMLASWPDALSYLTALRDPIAVGATDKDRNYLFYPLWPGAGGSGFIKHQVIDLPRSVGSSGSTRLRMSENLDPNLLALLEFKVTGMSLNDQLEVQLNNTIIPAEQIKRVYDPNGQSTEEGRPLSAFYLYSMAISSPPALFGDNELRLELIESTGTADLVAQEFEIHVGAPPTNCGEVFADGYGLMSDFSGDCHINLQDLGLLAFEWGNCNDPDDPDNCDVIETDSGGPYFEDFDNYGPTGDGVQVALVPQGGWEPAEVDNITAFDMKVIGVWGYLNTDALYCLPGSPAHVAFKIGSLAAGDQFSVIVQTSTIGATGEIWIGDAGVVDEPDHNNELAMSVKITGDTYYSFDLCQDQPAKNCGATINIGNGDAGQLGHMGEVRLTLTDSGGGTNGIDGAMVEARNITTGSNWQYIGNLPTNAQGIGNDNLYLVLGGNGVDFFMFDNLSSTAPQPPPSLSCEDIYQMGYGLDYDLIGDCRINVLDLAFFLLDWLRCNDPSDPACE